MWFTTIPVQALGTTPTTASVPEDDAASFRSDDSGDSEAFVVINQVQCCLLNGLQYIVTLNDLVDTKKSVKSYFALCLESRITQQILGLKYDFNFRATWNKILVVCYATSFCSTFKTLC